MRRIALILLVLIVACLVWFFKFKDTTNDTSTATNKPSNASPGGFGGGRRGAMMMEKTPVRLESIKIEEFSFEIKSLGTATAYDTAQITPKTSGQLLSLNFKEGQSVKKGDLLAKIDATTYQNAVNSANASYKEMQAQVNNAKTDLARYQKLYNADSIAKQTLDAQKAKVEQLNSSLQRLNAQLQDSQKQLADTQVKAPIDGIIGFKQVDVGNIVNNSTIIATITTQKPIAVLFSVPESSISSLMKAKSNGEKLEVEAWDKNDSFLIAKGELESIDNQIDIATGTIKLRAKFDNIDLSLFPNQFVNVKLVIEKIENAIIAPSAAIVYNSQGSVVYVVENETVRTQIVKVGSTLADKALILEGLNGDEQVITEGTERMKDGSKVSIVSLDGLPVVKNENKEDNSNNQNKESRNKR